MLGRKGCPVPCKITLGIYIPPLDFLVSLFFSELACLPRKRISQCVGVMEESQTIRPSYKGAKISQEENRLKCTPITGEVV